MRRMRQLPRVPLFWGAPLNFRGPLSKIAHVVLFRSRCFLKIIMKSGRKVENASSIRGEDLFFFKDHYDFGSKIGKSEMK